MDFGLGKPSPGKNTMCTCGLYLISVHCFYITLLNGRPEKEIIFCGANCQFHKHVPSYFLLVK